MRSVLSEFSLIANIEAKLTTYWHKRGEQRRNQIRYDKSWRETASTVFSANDVIIKRFYDSCASCSD